MTALWRSTIAGGGKWSGTVGRGKRITFTALEDGANLSLLMYHAHDPSERYNMPDTLKAQHTSHLTTGNVLMSDNGRVLASIVQDSTGWNDPIGGYTTKEQTDRKYGVTTYQEKRNERYRNGRDNFSVELVRSGLSVRDLMPPLNLFAKVYCDENGRMHHVPGHCKKGDAVSLRTELDLLLIVSNTPNPFDKRTGYPSVPVQIEVSAAEPVSLSDDACVNHCSENRRAFENTWAYHALRG
ncbi:urea amidolyase associated protein UAAP1 [Paenibacillus beijingensis]|uniref:Urea carboxylase n=1 Tax=Paenibacillus beijingensis TaxID=1126833 RepID=A0A0D5NNT6_9BACL|nr:urea amidolyase associated protein UAAP1 [Paenibacillus beijingensis]AJY76984.1 urea carboxylase [Paenibacillus beijingensis]